MARKATFFVFQIVSYEKVETISNCAGRHHSTATISIEGGVTRTGLKEILSKCYQRDRKKSIAVGDNTIRAKILGNFFENRRSVSA